MLTDVLLQTIKFYVSPPWIMTCPYCYVNSIFQAGFNGDWTLFAIQTLFHLATLPHCVVRGENKLNRAEMQIFPRGGERGREAGPQEYKSPAKLLFAFLLPLFNRKLDGRSGGKSRQGHGRFKLQSHLTYCKGQFETQFRIPPSASSFFQDLFN